MNSETVFCGVWKEIDRPTLLGEEIFKLELCLGEAFSTFSTSAAGRSTFSLLILTLRTGAAAKMLVVLFFWATTVDIFVVLFFVLKFILCYRNYVLYFAEKIVLKFV